MPQTQQRLSLACFSLVSSAACCRLFAVLSLLVCPAVVADDADPSLYVFRFIEVSPQNVAAWRDAVAAKQQQFADAPDAARWGTWKIVTGPRSGQFSRGFATTQSGLTNPSHPSQGLAADWNNEEVQHWLKNVTPLEESSGNTQIWRPIEGLSSRHRSSAAPARFSTHRRWRMKPGMYQRLEANYEKLVATFDTLDLPIDFLIARLQHGGDHMIYAETTNFDQSSDIPSISVLKEAFQELHGEGSWEQFLNEHNAIMQENAVVEDETWVYEADLSNLTPLPSD